MRALSFYSLLTVALFATRYAYATDFHLIYLGGQSNMDGYGSVSDLPESLQQGVPSVYIFHGNTAADKTPVDGKGFWAPLEAGHGRGHQATNDSQTLSERFGVELTLAQTLVQKYPDKRFAFVKYSRGGTSIDKRAAGPFGCWEPDFYDGEGESKGINQYDHFLATLTNALDDTDIDNDGETDRLIPSGIVWMQGESDGNDEKIAAVYQQNLKRLMDLIRAALRSDDLPVVIGRIADSGNDADGKVWDFGEQVRAAQEAFAENDPHAEWVSTDGYGFSDKWHYDSAGYIDMGKKFAGALIKLWE